MSTMEPLGLQVLGRERHGREEGPRGTRLWLVQGGETCGKGCSPSASSFLQLMSGQTQQKLPLLSLLKLGNQVQPGGAGEEWVGPEGGGPSAGARKWGEGGSEAEA